MATHLTLQLHQLFYNSNMGTVLLYNSREVYVFYCYSNRKSFGLDIRKRAIDNALLHSNPHAMEEGYDGSSSENSLLFGSLSRSYISSRRCSAMAVSAKGSFAHIDQGKDESEVTVTTTGSQEMEFNRVNCILWVLHESSRSFSQAVKSLRLAGSGPELAMAWLGKDVHEWHRRIAYQVAVYVLMKTTIDVEVLLSHDRQTEFSPVREM
ncbi:LETM1 and EF-hand domain-containing protein anon-60Da, mitochondrial [Senna tora]|uniref:LETM1 and EF-hand domain-containing protein anon-60Da, mitochondrial n=1 Tax=Senna tora TaxID=362788 RepID=A0A834T288_9FABA|nr:LETM1 and EF-hand domain-containing protein anon-60Da, mitochondrial [Senna tora]